MEGVDGRVLNDFRLLTGRARPVDFGSIDLGAGTQPEVEGLGGLGQVAASGLHLADHDLLAHVEYDQGADRIPVAPRPGQAEGDVVLPGETVAEVVGAVV